MDTDGRSPGGNRPWRWLCRYGPAEAAGILAALGAAAAAHPFGIAGLAALAAAVAESVAFYAVIVAGDLRARNRHHATRGRTIRDLLLEFGPAEALDSFLVRPAAMYGATAMTGNLAVGVLVGKAAADVAFYAVAIISYERVRASRAKDSTVDERPWEVPSGGTVPVHTAYPVEPSLVASPSRMRSTP